jgi:hypothetical protein
MSGAVLPDCLKYEDILYRGSSNIEERRTKLKPPCRLAQCEPTFERIWTGGLLTGAYFSIRLQISTDERGRLLYNGKLYNKNSWTWQPPKFIRLQGRHAKETLNPFNSYPNEIIVLDGKKIIVPQYCDACGGDLVYDHNMNLYCVRCELIQE